MSRTPLHLMTHPEDVSVIRLGPHEDPSWDWTAAPVGSLTRTADETSIVCLADRVPAGQTQHGPFRAVEIAGPLEWGMIGVLAEILDPLVKAQISILTLSTYDTDWILVPAGDIDTATQVWRRAGLIVTPSTLTGGGS